MLGVTGLARLALGARLGGTVPLQGGFGGRAAGARLAWARRIERALLDVEDQEDGHAQPAADAGELQADAIGGPGEAEGVFGCVRRRAAEALVTGAQLLHAER